MSDHRSDDRWGSDPASEDLDRPRRGRGLLAGLFVLLVLLGLYVGAAVYFGDRVPGGTTVAGVRVGGMTDSEARAAVERGVEDDVSTALTVEGAGKKASIDPADAGLGIDYDATLSGLTGFSLNPADVFAHVSGGGERDLVPTVDEDALAAAVDGAAKSFDKKAVEGSVSLADGKVKTKKSANGLTTDRDDLVGQISDRWPGTTTYSAKTTRVEPVLKQAEIDRFVKDELGPLTSGPVTVRTTDPAAQGDKTVTFPVAVAPLAAAVEIKNEKGRLSHTIDPEKVTAAVLAAGDASGRLRPAKDAEVVVNGPSSFSVSPSQTGLALKKDSVADPVIAAMAKSGNGRVATVKSEASQPKVTTETARATLPEEQISTFTTYLSSGGPRVDNIKLAARQLDGAYVAPGQTFSLNQHLGQRTAAKGYKEAGVIHNGRLRNDFGGGISQLSTTLFNAVFFSGARIEEFHPHSFYISRYPEGREATISWPDVDNRFTNDTKGGILIKASATDSEVTVSFYGRKTWNVEATKSERRNVVQPKTIRDDKEGCVPQSPAPGFTVTVGRIMTPVGGGAQKTSTFNTTYIPQDAVTCTNP